MEYWFCKKCRKVWSGPKNCCGEIEQFNAIKHSQSLISRSNAFGTIEERWAKDPIFLEVSGELTNDGFFCWATILNEFVERLKNKANE